MINLIQVNTQYFVELPAYVIYFHKIFLLINYLAFFFEIKMNMMWSAPLQIILSLGLLWNFIGIAALSGLITMIVIVVFSFFLSRKTINFQENKFKLQDSRLK
jgi:hypothetical protein